MPGTANSGGRNAKSRHLHVLAGTARKHRHADRTDPEPPKGLPVPPKPLDGDALEAWNRMTDTLGLLGVMSPTHADAIYQFARLFAETELLVIEKEEAQSAVQTLRDSQGDVEKSDLLPFFVELGKMMKLAAGYDSKIRSSRMALRQYLVEFGLTPAAVSRVNAPTGRTQDAEEATLARILAVK